MIMTDIGKSKGEIILELVKSINTGISDYYIDNYRNAPRVDLATIQYDTLVNRGIINEISND